MRKYISKQYIRLTLITLVIGLVLGWVLFYPYGNEKEYHHEELTKVEETIYTCSMHPQIKQNKPGLCPICSMDLVPIENFPIAETNVHPNEIQMTESALALASVQTTIVKRGVPEKNIQLFGKVMADERKISKVTARFGGRIEKLFINFTGQQVSKGEKLGTIYSPELITAQKELLEAMKYKKINFSLYESVRNKLIFWNLTDKQINQVEERGEPKIYFEILSPITGTVTKRYVASGDYIKGGSDLFEVVDLSKVWVMFDAYESDLPWIKKGDNVDFTIKSVPGEIFLGKVTYIDPFIDSQMRVARVRVELNNSRQRLKPEMFVNGILRSSIASSMNELLIPKSSVLWTGKRAVVYVKIPKRKNASFIFREIILGAEAGNFYVVDKGLSEGEEIVTNGVFKIDAAAQLTGKSSMMNPKGGKISIIHNHDNMIVDKKKETEQSEYSVMDMSNHSAPLKKDTGELSIHKSKANIKHEMFKVSGNCGMCKETIETAVKALKGVNSADWNQETKIIHISFNPDKVKLIEIHKAIAKVGYDTELEKADDDVYNSLPDCCQYNRTKEPL